MTVTSTLILSAKASKHHRSYGLLSLKYQKGLVSPYSRPSVTEYLSERLPEISCAMVLKRNDERVLYVSKTKNDL